MDGHRLPGGGTWPYKGFASGALDIIGHPKDAYYLYQSLWTEEPVLDLLPHWNWPGREGQVIPVIAYTNCNHVELFLNGRSLGEKRLEFPAQGTSGGWNSYAVPRCPTTNDLHVSWDVPYQPGVLRAVGSEAMDRDLSGGSQDGWTAGRRPAQLDRNAITAAPGDVAHVTFDIVDSAGIVVPTADNRVRFTVTGGDVLAIDNANLQVPSRFREERRVQWTRARDDSCDGSCVFRGNGERR